MREREYRRGLCADDAGGNGPHATRRALVEPAVGRAAGGDARLDRGGRCKWADSRRAPKAPWYSFHDSRTVGRCWRHLARQPLSRLRRGHAQPRLLLLFRRPLSLALVLLAARSALGLYAPRRA